MQVRRKVKPVVNLLSERRERLLNSLCEQVTGATGFSWVKEYRFCSDRKFRFDRAWPAARVGIEVDGGIWTQGRHTRGSGYLKDLEKFALAFSAGWWVLRVPWEWIEDGTARAYLGLHFSNLEKEDE